MSPEVPVSRTWHQRFLPASHRDDDAALLDQQRARILVTILLLSSILPASFGAGLLLSPGGTGAGIVDLIASAASIVVLIQLRCGLSIRWAGIQLLTILACTQAGVSFFTGGILSPAAAWVIVVPVLAIPLGRSISRAGIVLTVVSVAALGVASWFGLTHPFAVPSPYGEALSAWSLLTLALTLTYILSLSHQMRRRVVNDLSETNHTLTQEVNRHSETRTRLQRTHRELVDAARMAGAAEVATGVLHNLGNALNAVNTSASLIDSSVATLRLDRVKRLSTVLQNNPKAQAYVDGVARDLERQRAALRREVESLRRGVEHATATVAAQQRHAGTSGVIEVVELQELLDDALLLTTHRHAGATIVDVQCRNVPKLLVDRHRLVQIITNLVANAHDAIRETGRVGRISVNGQLADDEMLNVWVTDNGGGIAEEDLDRVFAHGFTTKSDGHGFGLHACALAASEIGGRLTVSSNGLGKGASFRLEMPVETAFTTYQTASHPLEGSG